MSGWKHGPDKNGGHRDVYDEHGDLVATMLGSDARRVVAAVNGEAQIRADLARAEAEAAELRAVVHRAHHALMGEPDVAWAIATLDEAAKPDGKVRCAACGDVDEAAALRAVVEAARYLSNMLPSTWAWAEKLGMSVLQWESILALRAALDAKEDR